VTPDEKFREEWIRLRRPGFYDYVKENHDRFSTAPPDLVRVAQEKWTEFYPDKNIPLCLGGTGVESTAPTPVEQEQEQEQPQTTDAGLNWKTDKNAWIEYLRDAANYLDGKYSDAIQAYKVKKNFTHPDFRPVELVGQEREEFAKILNGMLDRI
jgi:hypothetical protein